MTGVVSWGNLSAASDQTTGALIASQYSRSQTEVDNRIKALGPDLVGYEPDVVAAASAAVDTVLAGRNLAWQRGATTASANLDALRLEEHGGMYRVTAPALAEAAGLPERVAGTVWVEWVRGAIPATSVARQSFVPETGGHQWQRYSGPSGWSPWVRVDSLVRVVLPGMSVDDLVFEEHDGFWRIITQAEAQQIGGLPSARPGQLHVQWIRGFNAGNAVAVQTLVTEDGDVWLRTKTSSGFTPWVVAYAARGERPPVEVADWERLIMGNTLAVNAVAFACDPVTTQDGVQYAVWQDPARNPIVSRRVHGEAAAAAVNLAAVTGNPLAAPTIFDGHNNYVVGVSSDGIVHVSGNHHAHPLRYVRTVMPGDISEWTTDGALNPASSSITYPQFVRAGSDLLLIYRTGGSGNGATHVIAWNPATKSWAARSKPLSGLLEDGVSPDESPYTNYPAVGDDGSLHLFYVWRETSELSTTHDICHIYSTDGGSTWRSLTGGSLALPVTPTTSPVIIGGLLDTMNQCGAVVDAEDHPHAAFWIRSGNTTNLTHIWWTGTAWDTEIIATSSRTPWALPRPAMIRRSARVGIIYSATQDVVILTDVTTGGEARLPDRTILSGRPLGAWEPTFDSRALRERGELYMPVTAIQPNARSATHTPQAVYTARQGRIECIDLSTWA